MDQLMDAPETAVVLADWHERLNDPTKWRNPPAQYRYLVQVLGRLTGLQQLDPLERFDLAELAASAFCHFTEETPVDWRHPASNYDVHNDTGEQVGSILGNRYFLHGSVVKPGPMDFFAQIQQTNGKLHVITRSYAVYGELTERHIYTGTGQRLTLVETGRNFGLEKTRLDDPDIYRAVVEAALIALEEGDMLTYVMLWEKENFSIFRQCSRCCDRFDTREDCSTCAGQGFIEDPHRPDRLPSYDLSDRRKQA
ncbi:hypothetical protein ACI2KS_10865 [Pseudomonas sp. NPDC087358]|uniref:hypothetical protein n=1 Tax=Pseudomonas sp. NPDC087358 TaxID=3364439 RepID=UPI0038512C49